MGLSLSRFSAVALSAALLLPAAVPAAEWQVDSAHAAAQFAVKHMMISTVRGEFKGVTGTVNWDAQDITKSTVNVTIDATTVNTGEPKRDGHLKSPDFFDVAKFPTMTFKSTKIETAGDGKLKVTGDLTIHGVTKSVILDVDGPTQAIKDPYGNERVALSGTTKINRQDFGVKWNSPMEGGGVVVGDEVNITIDAELVKARAK
ncbi:MAG TPA: YceI family protein [Candidatus Acidoferrales bacterium]|nr:YceI family protein [Candidatus Acidoferrales bacterium]